MLYGNGPELMVNNTFLRILIPGIDPWDPFEKSISPGGFPAIPGFDSWELHSGARQKLYETEGIGTRNPFPQTGFRRSQKRFGDPGNGSPKQIPPKLDPALAKTLWESREWEPTSHSP